MGTRGYEKAAEVEYRPGEVILEVGMGKSTRWLADLGVSMVTIDRTPERWSAAREYAPEHVQVVMGFAERVLRAPQIEALPIGFAWLDGWDFPYSGNPSEYYAAQRAEYEHRGQEYSQEASQRSHLEIAQLIAERTRVIAFDDTWRTHPFMDTQGEGVCLAPVPPATTPAPALAMDHGYDRDVCLLEPSHPHHGAMGRGWDGKGGLAVPYLLEHGYTVTEYGLGLVVLTKEEA